MCGIYGYIQSKSKKKSLETCLEGLKKLQYRGYDSAGVASIHEGSIISYKTTGKVCLLDALIQDDTKELGLAIAHTRWATHGELTKENAHPQVDHKKSLALVHNGIIENYASIKRDLEKKGLIFSSQTDTEVISNLISYNYDGCVVDALVKSLKELEGSFAIVFIHKDFPETIYAASRGCPIAIGKCTKSHDIFISSDPTTFSNSSYETCFLQDEEIAIIDKDSLSILDEHRNKKEFATQNLLVESKDNDKKGYAHFMHKEIHEQSLLCREIILKRKKDDSFVFEELNSKIAEIKNMKHLEIVGCGSSFNAAMIAKSFLEKALQIQVSVHMASEYRYSDHIEREDTAGIFISQSGETADTLKALEYREKSFSLLMALCNEKDSTLARKCKYTLPIGAKKEVSVCSTKAFTGQLLNLYLLGIFFAKIRGKDVSEEIKEIKNIPFAIDAILAKEETIKSFAKKYHTSPFFFFTGRRSMYPVSMEAALKLKEVSYIYAEAIASGELKHGPIALIEPSMTTVAFLGDLKTKEKVISNLHEVSSRKGNVLVFGNLPENIKGFDSIEIADFRENTFISIPYSIAGQIFSYHIANFLDREIDFPRNLAKSVTVE